MDFITLFPKLSKKCVTLSSLDISYRVYVNWSEKGIVDYQVSDSHTDKDVVRKRVELSYFEALWLMIVKELRLLGMHLKHIKTIKEQLFAQMDLPLMNNIENKELLDMIDKTMPKEAVDLYKEESISMSNLQEFLKDIPEQYKIYTTNIAGLVQSVLLYGHSPSLMIYKKSLEEDLGFHIFNPVASEIEAKMNGRDFRDELVTNLIHHTVVNIPMVPLIAEFFKVETLFKYTDVFALYSPGELELLEILKQRDFQQIKIYNNENNLSFELEITNKKEVMNDKAKELKVLLGLKEYQRAELIFRNNKHIVIKNTIKKQI